MPSLTANWTQLLRLMLRRDRWWAIGWIIGVVVFCVFLTPLMPQMAGTPDKLTALAQMASNPALVAMCGVIYGGAASMGVLYSQMMIVWSGMLVATMSILVVVRHTAQEEECGRLELITATPTGRLASLTAAGVLMAAMNVAVALLTGCCMAAFNVASMDLRGSLVFGAAIGACGLLFGGLAMLVAQLVASSRTVTTVCLSAMGLAYIWRAYGDLESEWVARLSPLGLMQRTYPFEADRWWPVAVLAGGALLLAALALRLAAGRDTNTGLIREPRERQRQARWPDAQWGLIWQLTKVPVIAWAVTAFALSAGYGAVMDQMQTFVSSNPLYQQMMGIGAGEQDIMGPVVVTLILLMAMIAVAPILTTIYQLGAEEQAGRLDLVLSRPVARRRFFARLGGQALIVAVLMQLATAVGFWAVVTYELPGVIAAHTIFGIALNYLAALVAFGGLGLFLAGAAKRFTWVAWAYLVASFLVVYLGGMVNLPAWVMKLSPFGLLPRWPSEPINWWAWAGLVVAGLVLAALGSRGFRRRDVAS